MGRRLHKILALCLAFGACSGNTDETLNAQTVSGLLARQGPSTPSYTSYENLVIVPLEEAGDTQRLFVFHDDNRSPSVFQLTRAELPGLTGDRAAFRFSSKSNGQKVIAIYENGTLIKVGNLENTNSIPVTRPEIKQGELVDIGLELWLGAGSADSVKSLENIRLFESSYPNEVEAHPVSLTLNLFRNIRNSEPALMGAPDFLDLQNFHTVAGWDVRHYSNSKYDEIIILANKRTEPLLFPVTRTSNLRLHPLMSNGAYNPARQSRITLAGVQLPAKSLAVFVRPRAPNP